MIELKDTALLITHYNRSESLKRLLQAFEQLDIAFGQIVISDDASSADHISKLKDLSEKYSADLVLADNNAGLGNNINKGQRRVNLKYTLYVQEDFKPTKKFPKAMQDGLNFMEEDKDLDVIRFYAYRMYPHLIPAGHGFSIMNFKLGLKGYGKFYAYSDHPHLRRSSFFEKFGEYKENYNPEQTEYRMMMSFLQKKGKGLFYRDHKALFDHGNTEDEPSTMQRSSIRRSKNGLITAVRHVYRHLKFNLNYLFGKYV